MKHLFLILALVPFFASAITATKEYVDRKDGEIAQAATNYTDSATNGLLRTETDPNVPAWAKSATPPLPTDYATVSNRAMTALQEHQSLTNYYTKAQVNTSLSQKANDDAVVKLTGEQEINGGKSFEGQVAFNDFAGFNDAAFFFNVIQMYDVDSSDTIAYSHDSPGKWKISMGGSGLSNTIFYPNSSGTLALTSDIPNISGKADKADVSAAAQAATNYTDSAIAEIPAPDFSPSNATLVATIEETSPAPGDYATVSNKAMTALQSFTETDPTVPGWAKSETQPLPPDYSTVSNKAMTALQSYTESDPTISSWAKAQSKPTYTASEVGATTAEDVYRLIAGTNVVLVVTNYNSATHAPSMKLQHLDPESGQYVTYWDEMRRHGMTLTNAMDYTDAAIQTRAAPRAWSGTTSGLGSEAPAGVTWISTPETVIAGGYEYEKVITSAGAVWVLTSNGLTTGATTNSFFRVSASDGTELFSIEKTDSYLIGVNPDGITRSGNTVTIPVNVVAAAHPYIRATTNLVDAVWVKEDENGFSCPWATVSWSGTTGAYVATVTCSEPQAFFYFEYVVEGVTKIKNSAKTEMSGGILFNGTTYMPTVNGNKLEFVAQ